VREPGRDQTRTRPVSRREGEREREEKRKAREGRQREEAHRK